MMRQDALHVEQRTLRRAAVAPLFAVPMHYATACFIGALLTDLAYWQTYEVMWETFSDWLLVVGLLVAVLAVAVALVDLWRGWRAYRACVWVAPLAFAICAGLEVPNAFIHGRDGYTAVVPTGLTLSIIAVLVIAIGALVTLIVSPTAGGEV